MVYLLVKTKRELVFFQVTEKQVLLASDSKSCGGRSKERERSVQVGV